MAEHPYKTGRRRLYGRKQGRPLSAARAEALETLLPVLSVPENLLTHSGDLDPAALFKRPYGKLHLEIGFGNGEHLAALIRARPDDAFLGAEPFINGMAAFLKTLGCHPGESRNRVTVEPPDPVLQRDDSPSNIRVLMDDALKLVRSLKTETVDNLYILNPDPWPKKRHHKRRIVSRANLNEFARILKPGGTLIMTTDMDDLAEWMLTQTFTHPAFEWTARTAADWQTPPPGWLRTRYEEKGAKAGRRQTYLIFSKNQN